MKTFSNSLWVFAALFLLASCTKNKDVQPIPSAGVIAFNLVPDREGVVFTLSGNALNSTALQFNSYTGSYLSAYLGERTVGVYDAYTRSLLASSVATLEENKFYSFFSVGYDSTYKLIAVQDNYDSLSGSNGKAYVRYVNAVADSVNSAAVKVVSGSTDIINENAALGKVSDFKAVDPGEISISVEGADVSASRTITVAAKKVYTILLAGVPSETTDLKKVQVRYVEMGTLAEDTDPNPVSLAPGSVIR